MANPQLTPEEEKKEQLKLLTALIEDSLSEKQNDDSRKIFFFAKRTLRQFKLDGQLQESDIVIQAYLRVREKIKSGESIKNMPAYFNRVCYNIVREHSKKQKKTENLCNRLVNNGFGVSETNRQIDSLNYSNNKILFESLAQLNNEDREIIELRIVQELSWKEISDHISLYRNKKLNTSTLRKRGERILKRLREAYISVEQAYGLEAGGK